MQKCVGVHAAAQHVLRREVGSHRQRHRQRRSVGRSHQSVAGRIRSTDHRMLSIGGWGRFVVAIRHGENLVPWWFSRWSAGRIIQSRAARRPKPRCRKSHAKRLSPAARHPNRKPLNDLGINPRARQSFRRCLLSTSVAIFPQPSSGTSSQRNGHATGRPDRPELRRFHGNREPLENLQLHP